MTPTDPGNSTQPAAAISGGQVGQINSGGGDVIVIKATERIFLRRVGGGYIFVHRLLQDYLAATR